jgi:hypothetical protein
MRQLEAELEQLEARRARTRHQACQLHALPMLTRKEACVRAMCERRGS